MVGGGRSAADAEDWRKARRRRARDWVRKGGLRAVYGAWGFVVMLILGFVLAFEASSAIDEGGRGPWRAVAMGVAWLAVLLGFAFGLRRLQPRVPGPLRFQVVTDWVSRHGGTAVAGGLAWFNRRLVAGQMPDNHRTIAAFSLVTGDDSVATVVAVHGVSRSGIDESKRPKKRALRGHEIAHVIVLRPHKAVVSDEVVATLSDDPPSPLLPRDKQAIRVESVDANIAFKILSDDQRFGHLVFDPALIARLLDLASSRPRLLWDESNVYVSFELDVVTVDLLDASMDILDRMAHNARVAASMD